MLAHLGGQPARIRPSRRRKSDLARREATGKSARRKKPERAAVAVLDAEAQLGPLLRRRVSLRRGRPAAGGREVPRRSDQTY